MSDEPRTRAGGILGVIGLSPAALLVVAGIALAIWWYYDSVGQQLDASETAVVVLATALLVALFLVLWRALRRMRAKTKTPGDKAAR